MRSIRAKRGKAVIMDGGQVPHGGGRINEEYKASNHGPKVSWIFFFELNS